MINLKTVTLGLVAAAFVAGFTSCKEVPNSPGFEYMPDMYRTQGLRYYNEYTVNGGKDTLLAARLPVAGTISRDNLPGVPKGMSYEDAGLHLKNPLAYNAAVEKEGEVLYGKFCVHCHGDAGKGDGKVGLKLPGAPPAYDGALKNLPEGKIFYSISYGKGLMGNHAALLSVEERWKLVYYVQKLQGPKEAPVADTVAVKAAPAPAKKG